MQNVPQRIRRCSHCGNKTHRMLWKDEACPICGSKAIAGKIKKRRCLE